MLSGLGGAMLAETSTPLVRQTRLPWVVSPGKLPPMIFACPHCDSQIDCTGMVGTVSCPFCQQHLLVPPPPPPGITPVSYTKPKSTVKRPGRMNRTETPKSPGVIKLMAMTIPASAIAFPLLLLAVNAVLSQGRYPLGTAMFGLITGLVVGPVLAIFLHIIWGHQGKGRR